jgi:pyrroline-5-carboxylate reductase
MQKKIGWIGTGNMASALIAGILKSGFCAKEDLIGSDSSIEGRERTSKAYGIDVTADNKEVAKQAKYVILAVKPQYYAQVLSEIKDVLTKEQILISIAPGKSVDWLQEQLGRVMKVIRTMPNTPALVGEGMTGITANSEVTKEEMQEVLQIFSCIGKVEEVPESLMDAVVAVSGSSPAYLFLMLEAMADAAVQCGMPRAQAYRFAAQSMYGSAKLLEQTGKHPGELKDMVCSPAGTTIAAVAKLEEKGFRSAIIEAMRVCAEISSKM